MILSDRTIREELAAGRVVIDPLDEACIQPSSVDLHIDRYFRVFRNHTMGHIDVKQNLEDLTELVEIGEDDTFEVEELLSGARHLWRGSVQRVRLEPEAPAAILRVNPWTKVDYESPCF